MRPAAASRRRARDQPGAPPDLAPLLHETQRRVDSLRDTLDGLTGASDRLREVAQVVVEDHGRALVRLERATASQRAQAAGLASEHELVPREAAAAAAVVAEPPPAPPEPTAAPAAARRGAAAPCS